LRPAPCGDGRRATIPFPAGKIDIVVNAVGRIGPLVPVADTDPSEWTMTLSTNVIAMYLVLRAGLVNCAWFGGIKFRRLDRVPQRRTGARVGGIAEARQIAFDARAEVQVDCVTVGAT
jgi:hypothetical protein